MFEVRYLLTVLSVFLLLPAKLQGEDEILDISRVQTESSGISLKGFVDIGYIYNFTGDGYGASSPLEDRIGGRATDPDNGGRGDFSVFKTGLVIEKPLTSENTFQAGFKIVPFLGGEDSPGTESSAIELDQAYITLRIPVGNGLDMRFGKIVHYSAFEAYPRMLNMNITYGPDFFAVSGASTGIDAFYSFNENWDMRLGVLNGGTTWLPNNDAGGGFFGTTKFKDDYVFLLQSGVNSAAKNARLQGTLMYGPNGGGQIADFSGGTFVNRENDPFVQATLWGRWKPLEFDRKLTLAFANTGTFYGGSDRIGRTATSRDEHSILYTAGLYLQYELSDAWRISARGGYMFTDDQTVVTLDETSGAGPNHLWSQTVTTGIDLTSNVTIRFEYRADWGSNVVDSLEDDVVHTLASQVVLTY